MLLEGVLVAQHEFSKDGHQLNEVALLGPAVGGARVDLRVAVELPQLFEDKGGFRHSLTGKRHVTRFLLIARVLFEGVPASVDKDWRRYRGYLFLNIVDSLLLLRQSVRRFTF